MVNCRMPGSAALAGKTDFNLPKCSHFSDCYMAIDRFSRLKELAWSSFIMKINNL